MKEILKKVSLIRNKRNNQYNICLPKGKMSKSTRDKLFQTKKIDITLDGFHG